MENHNYKVYAGIDIHRREHMVAIMPVALLHQTRPNWKGAKILTIKNERSDFERLDAAIREYVQYPEEAAIAVDHTGGHYSKPLVYYLQSKRYIVCHLEAKAVKGAREHLLDEENKSDTIDATGVGESVSSFLRHSLGARVFPFTFTQRTKSELGFNLLAAINSGRLKIYKGDGSAECQEFWFETEKAKS